jgi:hypothetical protein
MPGQPAFVKVLDFGISKNLTSAGLTGEFDVLGTPDYMAPEQARGLTAKVDHRADQFALSAITFEMLTGVLPFAGDDVGSVLSRVINDDPPPIAQVAPYLPAAVEPVLRRALSKDPAARFPAVGDFAAALAIATGISVPPKGRSLNPGSDGPHSRAESAMARTEFAVRDRASGVDLVEDELVASRVGDAEPARGSDPGPTSAARPALRARGSDPGAAPPTERGSDPGAARQSDPGAERGSDPGAPPRRSDPGDPLVLARDPRTDPPIIREPPPPGPPLRRPTPAVGIREARIVIGRELRPEGSHPVARGTSGRPDPRAEPPSKTDMSAAPSAAPAARRPRRASVEGELQEQIDQARLALGLGDIDLAVDYVESALRIAARLEPSAAREALERESTLFDSVFETRLGSRTRRIVIRERPGAAARSAMTPEQAFLLTRLESGLTVEDAIDVSGVPRRDAMRVLVSLLRRRSIELE